MHEDILNISALGDEPFVRTRLFLWAVSRGGQVIQDDPEGLVALLPAEADAAPGGQGEGPERAARWQVTTTFEGCGPTRVHATIRPLGGQTAGPAPAVGEAGGIARSLKDALGPGHPG